jgi:hypothetical protein
MPGTRNPGGAEFRGEHVGVAWKARAGGSDRGCGARSAARGGTAVGHFPISGTREQEIHDGQQRDGGILRRSKED